MTLPDDLAVSNSTPCNGSLQAYLTSEQRAQLANIPDDVTVRCCRQARHGGECVGSLTWPTVFGAPAVLTFRWFILE